VNAFCEQQYVLHYEPYMTLVSKKNAYLKSIERVADKTAGHYPEDVLKSAPSTTWSYLSSGSYLLAK